MNEEALMYDSRFYVRAVGPQIKAVDASIGMVKPRQVASKLEQAGLAVTTVERSKKPTSPAIEEIKNGGWIDVIVFMGGV